MNTLQEFNTNLTNKLMDLINIFPSIYNPIDPYVISINNSVDIDSRFIEALVYIDTFAENIQLDLGLGGNFLLRQDGVDPNIPKHIFNFEYIRRDLDRSINEITEDIINLSYVKKYLERAYNSYKNYMDYIKEL